MKKLYPFFSCLFFSAGIWFLTGCQGHGGNVPAAGWEVGSGGDPLAAEFTLRAKFVSSVLNQEGRFHSLLSSADRAALSQAIIDTRVELTDVALSDRYGARVIGLVTPDPKRPGRMMIHVNRAGYLSGGAPGGQNLNQFVFHEYLWVLGKDDLNYRISNRLVVSEADFRRFKDLNGIEPPLLITSSAEPQLTGGGDEILGVDGIGNATVVWMQTYGWQTGARIYSQTYLVDKGWQPAELICQDDCGPPQISVGKNGDVVVAWIPQVRMPRTEPCGLWAMIRRNGAKWGRAECLGNPGIEAYGIKLSVSINAKGVAMIAAGNLGKALSYRFDPGDGWQSKPIFSFAAKSGNELMKLWEADSGDAATLISSDGAYHVMRQIELGDWTDSLDLPSAVGLYGTPKLSMDHSGRLLLTWGQTSEDGFSILARGLGTDGDWGAVKNVAHFPRADLLQWVSLFPLMEAPPDDSVIAWTAQLGPTTEPASNEVGVARQDPSGAWKSSLVSWGEKFPIAETVRPVAMGTSAGDIDLVWSSSSGQIWVGDTGASNLSPRLLSNIGEDGQILDFSVVSANGKGFVTWKEKTHQGLAIWVNHFDL